MSDAPVLTERRGANGDVLLVTLNRPERHNAMNAALNHVLGVAVRDAEADGINVIVLTGAGEKSFCAGGDMLEMSGVEKNAVELPPPGQRLGGTEEISKTPLPVIAAINGYCYGGGARLAIACDIRLASETATFRLPGAEYGLVVAAASLPRLVGASKAKEWIFTARKFDAREALDAGLVSTLYQPDELLAAALEMAEVIAGHSASSVRESKRVIDLATLSAEASATEVEVNRGLRGSPEQTERFRDATKRVTGR
ncbi:MAG: enoyl-CoA hydratase/isomerase family protein [Chloroflexi bacterium]|nr:enoyl-CoA hydratase/isomerase family protein [Chloroflexota bacterium]MDA1145908.1 enoyl-CoA hydratase/isomerase family protein [Chloroflexota bacterium]